jgi:hypothetical protein
MSSCYFNYKIGFWTWRQKKKLERRMMTDELRPYFSTHQTRLTVTWIEDMMSFKPISMMMMVSIMRMFVCHSMCMSVMSEEVCMFIQVLSIFVGCYFAEYVGQLHSSPIMPVNCIVTAVELPLATAAFA